MPGDAGLTGGLEFCRREIERQRDVLRRVLLWSFGPVLLTIGTFILALAMVSTKYRGIFPNGLPFLILIVIWVVAYFIIRFREQRELQRETDQLNDIEKENRQLLGEDSGEAER
jgi:Flp pilus assembly protein TadB